MQKLNASHIPGSVMLNSAFKSSNAEARRMQPGIILSSDAVLDGPSKDAEVNGDILSST